MSTQKMVTITLTEGEILRAEQIIRLAAFTEHTPDGDPNILALAAQFEAAYDLSYNEDYSEED